MRTFKAINAANGASLWDAPFELATLNPAPAVGAGLLFSGRETSGEEVCAYDGTTGQRRWVFNTGDAVFANPVFAGSAVYVATGRGTVYAIDPASGQARWRRTLARTDVLADVLTPPIVSGGLVYGGRQQWPDRVRGERREDPLDTTRPRCSRR